MHPLKDNIFSSLPPPPPHHHHPYCNIILALSFWFRDFYEDKDNQTQPRMRALAFVLATFFPNWSKVDKIHESSPQRGGLSSCLKKLVQEGKYLGSQYSAHIKCGENIPDSTDVSLDLEKQCLDSASIGDSCCYCCCCYRFSSLMIIVID